MSMFDSGLPSITVLCDVPFPATLISGPGIQVLTADPTAWEMSLDYDPLPEDDLSLAPLSNYYLAVEDTTETPPLYNKVRLDHFGNQVLNIDQRTAIGDQSYNVTTSDRYVGLTTPLSLIPRVISLPPASTMAAGRQLTLQDECGGLSGTAYWTVVPNGNDLIDGKNVLYMSRRYAGYRLTCDGVANWSIAAPTGMSVVSAVPSYGATPDDTTVGIGVISGASVTVTLPPCLLCFPGKTITVLDLGGQCSPTSTIVVRPQTGELINGVPAPLQATLNANYSYITLQTDGSGRWTVVAGGTNPATDTITSTQISDSTSTGRNVLTAASQTLAQQAIGAGAIGSAVFGASTTELALDAMGASPIGAGMFVTANPGTAQALLGLGNMATQNNTNVNITGGTVASTQLNNCPIVGGTIDNTVIGSTSPANASFANITAVGATFTGAAHGVTPTAGDNSNLLATTAFVQNLIAVEGVPPPFVGTPSMAGVGNPGTSVTYSRGDHQHPSDTSKASLTGATFSGAVAANGNVTSNATIAAGQGAMNTGGYALWTSGSGPCLFQGTTQVTGALLPDGGVYLRASYGNQGGNISSANGQTPGWGVAVFGIATTNVAGHAFMHRQDNLSSYLSGYYAGGNFVGNVYTNGSTTAYNTTSDVRMKENIRPITDDIDVGAMIDAIEPVAFEWNIEFDPELPFGKEKSNRTGHGFVAQHLHTIAPHAVTPGVKFDHKALKIPGRDYSEEGTPWGVDFSKLVPYLVAELQSLRRRVAQLEGG